MALKFQIFELEQRPQRRIGLGRFEGFARKVRPRHARAVKTKFDGASCRPALRHERSDHGNVVAGLKAVLQLLAPEPYRDGILLLQAFEQRNVIEALPCLERSEITVQFDKRGRFRKVLLHLFRHKGAEELVQIGNVKALRGLKTIRPTHRATV